MITFATTDFKRKQKEERINELELKEKNAIENKGSFMYEPHIGKANAKIIWCEKEKDAYGQTTVRKGWWVLIPSTGNWYGAFRSVERAKRKTDEEIG